MKALEVFKPGKHPATNGQTYKFSEAQVAAIAEAYDPALHQAPYVIGHPKGAAPSYGWANAFTFSEGKLKITEQEKVDPAFAEMVNAGRFNKISLALYAPDDENNPKPGSYYPHHVAFLGAQPPAVKGLKSAEFGEADANVIEFMDWTDRDVASLFRGLREWIIGKFGKDEADKVIPDYLVTSLTESAVQPNNTDVVAYSEQEKEDMLKQEQLAAQEAVLNKKADAQAAREIAFAEREKSLKASEAERRRVLLGTEVDVLVAAGKILPKDKAPLVAFMETLDAGAVIEFGEGDKKEKKPSIEWLRGFLKTLPKAVEFAERGANGVERIDESNPQKAGEQLAMRAVEFQESERKAGRIVSIDVAVEHVANK
jgi:hypothetical protein